ncbi:hypothetical protein ACFFX0_16205 [Citricoccus parietis]|uniref:Uncharacterized protein n=1 Tax=Citricoccus parietis TaxID=592307 RepID=A0ABV5G144_9MICC
MWSKEERTSWARSKRRRRCPVPCRGSPASWPPSSCSRRSTRPPCSTRRGARRWGSPPPSRPWSSPSTWPG